MKLWFCLALLFLATNAPVKPNLELAQADAASEQKTENAVPNDQARSQLGKDKPAKAPAWYASVEWANWALVLIGAVTACAVWWQAKKTAEATQAMRDAVPLQKSSADAALLNAQAVINSDRPWVVIFADPDSFGNYGFYAGNLGNTPADIISYAVGFRCVNKIVELPDVPEYWDEQIPMVKILVPGRGKGGQTLDLLVPEMFADFADKCDKSRTDRTLKTPPKVCVFYFRVLYSNVLSRINPSVSNHETRMCFCWTPSNAGEKLT